MRVNVMLAVPGGVAESDTVTVKVVGPDPVGVPEIAPAGDNVSPRGSAEPEANAQVYGDVPPVAASVAEYAAFWVAAVNGLVVVIVTGTTAAFTVSDNALVAVAAGVAESVAVTLKAVVPCAVGVPEMIPADDIVSPAGRVEPDASAQVYGPVPPEAASVSE